MTRPPLDSQVNTTPGLAQLGSIPPKAPSANFNISGVENLIDTKGFKGTHYKHALIPDRHSLVGPINPSSQESSQRGYFFYSKRPLIIVPYSSKVEERLQVQGIFNIGSYVFNISGQYSDEAPGEEKKVYGSTHDLVTIDDITIETREEFEYNPTGPQKLKYYIRGVSILFAANSGDITRYVEDRDFVIYNGMIHWTDNGQRPSFINGQGTILSIVYYINPIYVVKEVPHHLRLLPSNPQGNANYPRQMEYAPQLWIMQLTTLASELNYDFYGLYNSPDYAASKNVTGGSY